MTNKVYRTAQGKIVDLGALILQNEQVRAVGNMGVNARGDRIDSQGQSIDSRNQQMARQYNRQISSNVMDQPVGRASREVIADEPVVQEVAPVDEPAPVEDTSTDDSTDTSGGLAAAIAKARQIKQEPLKTPRQTAQSKPGVNKI
jgi:hypothetical protein